MDIKISGKEFIEIKGITHMISSKASLETFRDENSTLSGDFYLELEYFTNKDANIVADQRTILFTIIKDQNTLIEGVTMDKYDFSVVDNQGLEMEYSLTLHTTEVLVVEEIKDSIIDEASKKLDEILEERDEGFLDSNLTLKETEPDSICKEFVPEDRTVEDCTTEKLMNSLEESYATYKVVFINEESEIEEVASKYNKKVSDIYEENNFAIKNHLIIKVDE